jgi:cytidylate kinase
MAIVTISRGSYSHGKEVAEILAGKLGYTCISREIILEASKHFNIPEIKLIRAIDDAPSLLDRFTYGKERYVAFIREALLHHFQKDNVVYHGFAGQFLVPDVSHVLKVRILAEMAARVRKEMAAAGLSPAEARANLEKDDEERQRWSHHLYGIDIRDLSLYDLAVHIKTITTDGAVDLIYEAVRQPGFQTTAASQKAMDTLFLASQVQAALVQEIPAAQVEVEEGELVVRIGDYLTEKERLIAKVDQVMDNLKGVKVKVRLISP